MKANFSFLFIFFGAFGINIFGQFYDCQGEPYAKGVHDDQHNPEIVIEGTTYWFGNWVYLVGNPNPKTLIFKAKLARNVDDDVEKLPSKADNQAWEWLTDHIPGFDKPSYLCSLLMENKILYPDAVKFCEKSLEKDTCKWFLNFPCIHKDFYKILPTFENVYSRFEVETVENTYWIDTMLLDSLKFYNFFGEQYGGIHICQNPFRRKICFDEILPFCQPFDGCGKWLCVLKKNTLRFEPVSKFGRKYTTYSPTQERVAYELDETLSAHASCWHKSRTIPYLNWYAHEIPKGFEPQRHENKAYYLDTLFNTLVIGEQNPQTGEWQGNFEAYSFAENTPATLFLKGRHDRNKRVGIWKYYNFYNTEKPILQTDSISSEGIFISGYETPFEGFSEAELAKFEQTVQAIVSKNKK